MTRAAILARVSRAEQAREDRHSLPVQVALLTDYVARKGWELAETFEIPGESAYRDRLSERPQFRRAVQAALRGEFDVIVVLDISRFARNQEVLHSTLGELRRHGIEVWAQMGDLNATADRFLAGIHGAVAEQHSILQSEKIQLAYARRHARGLPTGDVPFGYRRTGTDTPPAIVPDEAEAVRWAFAAYTSGTGHVEIAAEFNRRGLRPHSKQGYEGFVASSVQRIIENRFYAGVVVHRGSERPGLHVPVITEAAWRAANDRTRRRAVSSRADALLTGIARCSACSGPIWTSGWDRRRTVRYYREPSHQQLRSCRDARMQWRSDEPDGQVAAMMRALGVGADWLSYVEREARLIRPEGTVPDAEALREERRRLGELYRAGVLDATEWRREDAALKARLSPAGGMAEVLRATERLGGFAQLWDVASPERRREAVRIVLRAVTLDMGARAVVSVEPREEYREIFSLRRTFAGSTPDRGEGARQHTWSLAELGVVA